MTATMKKPKVEGIEIKVAEPKFRFKITNTKLVHYPDPLIVSDYHGVKVGDIVTLGFRTGVLYEVEALSREPMPDLYQNVWRKRLYSLGVDSSGKSIPKSRELKLTDLLDSYIKTGNFGVNVITLKTLLRGNKISKRRSIKKLFEPDTTRHINFRNQLEKVDIPNLISQRDYQVRRAKINLTKVSDKIKTLNEGVEVLRDLMNARNIHHIITE